MKFVNYGRGVLGLMVGLPLLFTYMARRRKILRILFAIMAIPGLRFTYALNSVFKMVITRVVYHPDDDSVDLYEDLKIYGSTKTTYKVKDLKRSGFDDNGELRMEDGTVYKKSEKSNLSLSMSRPSRNNGSADGEQVEIWIIHGNKDVYWLIDEKIFSELGGSFPQKSLLLDVLAGDVEKARSHDLDPKYFIPAK